MDEESHAECSNTGFIRRISVRSDWNGAGKQSMKGEMSDGNLSCVADSRTPSMRLKPRFQYRLVRKALVDQSIGHILGGRVCHDNTQAEGASRSVRPCSESPWISQTTCEASPWPRLSTHTRLQAIKMSQSGRRGARGKGGGGGRRGATVWIACLDWLLKTKSS